LLYSARFVGNVLGDSVLFAFCRPPEIDPSDAPTVRHGPSIRAPSRTLSRIKERMLAIAEMDAE